MYDITPIINAVIALLGAIIVAWIIPLIKQKVSGDKYKKLQTWIQTFVLAAEQLYGAGNGRAKLEYVGNMLRAKGIEVDIDDVEDEIRAMIEAAVRELGDKEIKESDNAA